MELHHFGFSTCSQKVRLVLAEKGLEFESHEVNLLTGEQHDPEYVKLNPKHVVPTLVHDGRVLVESTLIIRYLDDAFPEPTLRPSDALARYDDEAWLKHIDDVVHVAAPVVTFALGPRAALLAQPEEVREANLAKIPDPRARAVRRSVIEHGVLAPEFRGALGVFLDALDAMERDLAARPWLSGARPGLADAAALPYVLRVEQLALDPLIDARPRVAVWLGRWKARPSYATAVDAWAAPAAVEMMRTQGKAARPDVERIVAAHAAA
jgi:glutathione S-transferase